MNPTLRKVNVGEPFYFGVGAYNAFVDAANDFKRRQPPPFSAPKPRRGGGSGGIATLAFARITAHSGTQPFRYTATQVTPGGDPVVFSDLSGGISGDRFINLAELAGSACPAKHVPNGSIVFFIDGGNTWYYFSFENQSGVYA